VVWHKARVRTTCGILLAVLLAGILIFVQAPARVGAAASLTETPIEANSGSSPASATFSPTATAGKLLVVICSTNTAATITGPSGYTTAINESGSPAQGIFYKVAAGGEGSTSCSFSAGGEFTVQLYEYSGIENITPLDAKNTTTSTGSTNPASSGTVTTNNASDLLLAAVACDTSCGVDTGTWSNTFTKEIGAQSGGKPSTRIAVASADLSVSSAGSYSTTDSYNSGNWHGQIVAFKIAPTVIFGGDIVDGSGGSVSSPSVAMTTALSSFACQTSTGTLGTSTQKIRITNTDPSRSLGWTLTIGASTSNWNDSSGHTYAYNNSAGSPAGCTSGQLTVNPTAATITPESSPEYGCTNTGVTDYSSSTALTGSTQATLVTAGATASYYCYWDITGISLSQKIPPGQHGGSYTLGMTLTLTSN
jgi:hypothetical protein